MNKPKSRFVNWTAAVLFACASGTTMFAAACDTLATLKLQNTTILSAKEVAAGEFVPPPGPQLYPGPPPSFKNVPAFCRVVGAAKPTTDSNIQFEVWMPSTGWNGKFQGIGVGGFAGSIPHAPLAMALTAGYATATTDTGHTGGDASFALGHPEKLIDYGHRGVHEMTAKAKEIIAAFYGSAAKRSYFDGCSNGGRQALMEAQRYPADYDGIIAGAPANNFTDLVVNFAWNAQALTAEPGSFIPAAKLKAIEAAALSACDARDGLADGVIDSPPLCRFDPAVLLCKGADADSCLTEPQVGALKKIYSGPKTPKGKSIFPGFVPGGELGGGGWQTWILGQGPGKSLQVFFATQFFGNMVFANPAWDLKTFDLDKDTAAANQKVGPILNATDPNLKPFHARGGKLILWHGWSDSAIPAQNAIDYYQSVRAKVGASDTDKFVRLYMVPGMHHCGGGPGPNVIGDLPGSLPPGRGPGMATALERWVEDGVAPDQIIAAKLEAESNPASKVIRTRPLCPYPLVARYKGTGSIDEAANFSCAVEPAASGSGKPR